MVILYLAQSYSKYPQVTSEDVLIHQAYRNAVIWKSKLWDLGFECYSPICDTHPMHLAMGKPNIDYVKHDLAIVEAMIPNVVMVFADDCLSYRGIDFDDSTLFVDEKKSKGAKTEYDFAVKNHIRCIRLTELLEKKKIDKCEVF